MKVVKYNVHTFKGKKRSDRINGRAVFPRQPFLGSNVNSISKSGMFCRWRRRVDNGRAVTPLATADAAHYVREIPPRPPFDNIRLDGRYAWNSPPLSENHESMEGLGDIYF